MTVKEGGTSETTGRKMRDTNTLTYKIYTKEYFHPVRDKQEETNQIKWIVLQYIQVVRTVYTTLKEEKIPT